MKKVIVVFALLILMSVGAFADHPSGWGVGVVGQGGFSWDGFDGSGGAALSLKTPQLPVYWGINFSARKNFWGISATGDLLVIDYTMVRDINLGWFLGLGAYGGIYGYSGSGNGLFIRAGARVPIGIYIFPVNFLEIFFDLAPSLGLGVGIGEITGIEFPDGGIGAELGIRFWF